MKKSKKAIIIVVCCVLAALVVGGSVVAVNIYNNNVKEQKIEDLVSEIKGKYDAFVSESDRNSRVEIIKKLENDFEEYLKDKEPSQKVKDTYHNELEQMKSYFIAYYDKVINDNTLKEVEKIIDKSKLNSCKNLLTALLEKIEKEKDAVITNEKFEEYKSKIKDLIDSYTQRIEEIEKAEQEAKEKLEQEAKALSEESDKNDSSEETAETDNTGYEDEDYSNDYSDSDSDSEYDSSDDSDTPNDIVPITPFPYEELQKEYIEKYGSDGWFWN